MTIIILDEFKNLMLEFLNLIYWDWEIQALNSLFQIVLLKSETPRT